MSRAIKRKIVINGVNFYWVLNGNRIDSKELCHIKIHSDKATKSMLYVDAYDWSFEICPKTIREGILFALSQGWLPAKKETGMIISMRNENFYVLPEGKKFGYELDE